MRRRPFQLRNYAKQKLRQSNPNLHLIAALPYPSCESRWLASWKDQYAEVLQSADLVTSICPKYSMASFQKRDEWMIDHSSRVIAVYDGVSGGTKNKIDLADKCESKVGYIEVIVTNA